MFQSEQLQEKWKPLLEYEGLDPIKDNHRKAVTAVLLENQEKFLKEEQAFSSGINLMEAPTNSANSAGAQGGFGADSTAAGPTAGFDSPMGKKPEQKIDGRRKYVKKYINQLIPNREKRKNKKAIKNAMNFNPYFK